jgi:hypothetical protein
VCRRWMERGARQIIRRSVKYSKKEDDVKVKLFIHNRLVTYSFSNLLKVRK